MTGLLKKHSSKLKTAGLLLMLLIPFLLYLTASYGSILQVKLLLGAMTATMLIILKTG